MTIDENKIMRIFDTYDCGLIMEGLHNLFVYTEKLKDIDPDSVEKLKKIISLQKNISDFTMYVVHNKLEVWIRFDGVPISSYIIDEL